MDRGTEYTGYDKEIEELIISMGYGLSDYSSRRIKNSLHVHVVLYDKAGVSLNDCSEVYKTILPKLEMLYDTRDIHLEVSSPGVSRIIKTIREMGLYLGKGVSLLHNGIWIGGILQSVSDTIVIQTPDGQISVHADEIQKAKLDYTQEVVE